jgi:hypothetical protein
VILRGIHEQNRLKRRCSIQCLHRLLFIAKGGANTVYPNLRMQEEGYQIHSADDEHPHKVDKVPVHLTRLNSKMILRRKVSAQGTNEADEQEK